MRLLPSGSGGCGRVASRALRPWWRGRATVLPRRAGRHVRAGGGEDLKTKAMTLRLPMDKAAELEAVARAESKSVTDTVRDAIDLLIAERRKDKAFRERVRKVIEDDSPQRRIPRSSVRSVPAAPTAGLRCVSDRPRLPSMPQPKGVDVDIIVPMRSHTPRCACSTQAITTTAAGRGAAHDCGHRPQLPGRHRARRVQRGRPMGMPYEADA